MFFTVPRPAPRAEPPHDYRHCWPEPQASGLSLDQSAAALRGFLSTTGHDASDFELRLAPASWLNGMLGMGERFMAVRCISSRRERLYAAEAHSPWMAELLNDLEHGAFAA